MKKNFLLLVFLFSTLSSFAQLKNGSYQVKGYTSEYDGEITRDGEFLNGAIQVQVMNGKFISVVSNKYPFYVWQIEKTIRDNKGYSYYMKDVRNATPQFVYYEYQEKDSKMFKRECIILYIYWSESWIDKLFLIRD